MSNRIGNYELDKPLSNKNAGCCKWGFGRKNNKEYFIKEFLSPIYPDNIGELNQTTLERKQKICKEFEIKETTLIKQLNCASDGNVLRIHEFFRYGSKYYIATEKVNGLDENIIENLSFVEKIRIMKVLAHSLSCMHKKSIVHGDIKMNNILFMKSRNDKITAKIIDIDNCFFENDIPEPDYLVGDPVYMAPETFRYIATESGKIDCKLDVFAMGIIFHQILTGKLPKFDTGKYKYVYECVLDDGKLLVDFSLKYVFELLMYMLEKDPEKRISMAQVFNLLNEKTNVPDVKTNKDSFFVKAGDL